MIEFLCKIAWFVIMSIATIVNWSVALNTAIIALQIDSDVHTLY